MSGASLLGEEAAAAWAELEQAAIDVARRAHAPYSRFQVGAAVRTRSGRVFAGCNVENASFGLTVCAERSAIVQMVSAGERDPVALAVATSGTAPASPCGMCRQTLAEFADDLPIHLVSTEGAPGRKTNLRELLPDAFREADLPEISREDAKSTK